MAWETGDLIGNLARVEDIPTDQFIEWPLASRRPLNRIQPTDPATLRVRTNPAVRARPKTRDLTSQTSRNVHHAVGLQ